MERAVFFDVDGVIRHNNTSKKDGYYYCLDCDQVDYINGIFKAHKYLQDAGYKIFWVTMQNCIKEGKITEDKVHEILQEMIGVFKQNGSYIEDYQICQSKEETDESKTMAKVDAINKLSMVYNIDNSRSIGIGDRQHDIDAYKFAGIETAIHAVNPYGDKKYQKATHHYHIKDYYNESLFELLMQIHGCNDVPRIVGLMDKFHHVKKIWGDEYWIVNSLEGNYCSKILVLQPDHISSLHYHKNKCETFTILAGAVNIEKNRESKIYIHGDSILIQPIDKHRFEALVSPAVILETSTWHDDLDTYRLEDSK